MGCWMKFFLMIALALGVVSQASAKNSWEKAQEKAEKERQKYKNKKQKEADQVIIGAGVPCHWLGTPSQDEMPGQPLCNGEAHTVGLAQCGAWTKTAYCRTKYAGNVQACLYADNDGDTKKCFEKSFAPLAVKLKQFGKPGAIVKPACSFPDLMVTGYQDTIAQCSNGEEYVVRRASCSIGAASVRPIMFCHNSTVATSPITCMGDEGNASTSACRSEYFVTTGRSTLTGEKAGSTAGSVQQGFEMKFAIAALLFGSISVHALEAGPFVLNGVIKSSNEKTLTLTVGEKGEQEADIPLKLVPKSLAGKDGKFEAGKKVSLAFTPQDSKQIKIHKP